MKSKQKSLTKRQLDVIEDMVRGDMDEPQLLSKHRLTRRLLRLWLKQERFAGELSLRKSSAQRQSGFLLARYSPTAAAKLVALTESEKDETVRKACLDIIAAAAKLPGRVLPGSAGDDTAKAENPPATPISSEKASKVLAILAEKEKRKITTNINLLS